MTLSPAAIEAADALAKSLAPPTPEEGALMRVIWLTPAAEEARAS